MPDEKPSKENELTDVVLRMNKDITVDLPSEKDDVALESDAEIFRKGKTGELIINQPDPPITIDFVGKETDIIFTFKDSPVTKQISAVILKVNNRFVLIKLTGFVTDAQDRRDNMRLNISADKNVHFNVVRKETGYKLPGVKPVNISNTGARFGYEKCPGCDERKTCIHKLKRDEEVKIEMIFKETDQKFEFDAIVKSTDFKSQVFFSGIHFNTTRTMNDMVAKIVRFYEKKIIKVKNKAKEKLISKKINTPL